MTEQEMKLTSPGSAHRYFMSLAKMAATRSPHPRFRHGAIIVDDRGILDFHTVAPFPIAIGYNRPPRHVCGSLERYWELGKEYSGWTIHAEEDALLRGAKGSYAGCSMFVTGLPCPRCTIRLLDAGLVRVVYGQETYTSHEKDLPIIRELLKISDSTRFYELGNDDKLTELAHD